MMNIIQRLERLEAAHADSDVCVVEFEDGTKAQTHLSYVIDLLRDENKQPVSVSMVNGKEPPLYRLIVGMIEE